MAEIDRSGAPAVPPEVPVELADVYRSAYLAAYVESGERLATGPDRSDEEPEDEDALDDRSTYEDVAPPADGRFPERLKANLSTTSGRAGSRPARPPVAATTPTDRSPGAWSSFRASPWFVPLLWTIATVLLVLLAYIAGRSLASSLS